MLRFVLTLSFIFLFSLSALSQQDINKAGAGGWGRVF